MLFAFRAFGFRRSLGFKDFVGARGLSGSVS